MKAEKAVKHSSAISGVWAACVCIFALCCSTLAADSGFISDVSVEPQLFNPSRGQSTAILFKMPGPGTVSVKVYDSDHFLIASVQENKAAFAGLNRVNWNGRDNAGAVVPDDAYYFVIDAVDDSGARAQYDPTLFSGGETLQWMPPVTDREAGQVRFTLAKAARVRLRAGILDGPLSRTLLDWTPKTAGDHKIAWDGTDSSGLSKVWDHKRFIMSLKAFALPDNSIITEGNPTTYMQYWSRAAGRNTYNLTSYRLESAQGRVAYLKGQKVRSLALQERGPKIENSFLTSRFFDRSPEFTIKVDGTDSGGVTKVASRETRIEIELTDAARALLSEQRFEYVLYIDNVLYGEEENGQSPYTWREDLSKLSPGKHLVTINVATLTGQVGAASAWIEVQD